MSQFQQPGYHHPLIVAAQGGPGVQIIAPLRGIMQCEFVRPRSCPHAQPAERPLFSAEYTRTNRTRATKIVRCFPHCCPTHRPRSYCGAPLYVQVSARADAVAGRSSELVVVGRFEEHRPELTSRGDIVEPIAMPLELGQRVLASDIIHARPGSSIWVHGKRQDDPTSDVEEAVQLPSTSATTTTSLYVLRSSTDHWESDWRSGTSYWQRSTKHHFRVYVFRPLAIESDHSHVWQVVGIATSPTFTFAVYRKQQHDPELVVPKECDETNQQQADDTPPRPRSSATRLDAPQPRQGTSAETLSGVVDNNQSDAHTPSLVRDLLWHRQHRRVVQSTTNIAILMTLAAEADPGWLTMQPRSLFALLRAVVPTAVPEHLLLHYVSHCVLQLMALLPRCVDQFSSLQPDRHQHDYRSDKSTTNWQSVMQLISELLCFVLDPAQTAPVLAFVSANACLPSLSIERRRDLFVDWVERIADQVEGFLQARGTSTNCLVDDVVSIALANKTSESSTESIHHTLRSLLRNTKVMGQSHFDLMVDKLRAATQVELAFQHHRAPYSLAQSSGQWTGQWICRSFEHGESLAAQDNECRRHSWPRVLREDSLPHEPDNANGGDREDWSDEAGDAQPKIGLLAGLTLILSAFGVQISDDSGDGNDGDDCGVFGVYLVADPLVKGGGQLPLDFAFRDATHILPCGWSALLGGRRAFYRARTVCTGTTTDNARVELEFFAHRNGDQELTQSWRCLVVFELVASRSFSALTMYPIVTQRRRMHVHVRLEEAQGTKEYGAHSVDSHTVEPSSPTLQLYNRIASWSPRITFKGVYYAME